MRRQKTAKLATADHMPYLNSEVLGVEKKPVAYEAELTGPNRPLIGQTTIAKLEHLKLAFALRAFSSISAKQQKLQAAALVGGLSGTSHPLPYEHRTDTSFIDLIFKITLQFAMPSHSFQQFTEISQNLTTADRALEAIDKVLHLDSKSTQLGTHQQRLLQTLPSVGLTLLPDKLALPVMLLNLPDAVRCDFDGTGGFSTVASS